MKIYQIHEYSGKWEDFRDIIVGSYLRKERAEEELLILEQEEKVYLENKLKCLNCPFIWDDEEKLDILLSLHQDYCAKRSLTGDDYGIRCENYTSYHDNRTYRIKEVEVEE